MFQKSFPKSLSDEVEPYRYCKLCLLLTRVTISCLGGMACTHYAFHFSYKTILCFVLVLKML